MPIVGAEGEVHPAGTCSPWASSQDLCSPCSALDFDGATMDSALRAASDVLFNLTGRRWPGVCSDVVRPCGGHCSEDWCGCGTVRRVELPGWPVVEVTEVLVDGVVVDPARYTLLDRRYLIATDLADGSAKQRWPVCQRLDRAASEERTFQVAYDWGADPPVGGVRAAAVLACELYRACTGDAGCQLPQRVQSITRQGVTMSVLDPLTLFAEGRTGLTAVDLWVESVRLGDRRRARVVDPTRPRVASRRP